MYPPPKLTFEEMEATRRAGLKKLTQKELDELLDRMKFVVVDNEARTCVLTKLDLDGLSLAGRNLSHMEISNCSIQNANLDYADLRYATIKDTQMRRSTFREADLSFAKLTWSSLREAVLQDANLTGVIVDSTGSFEGADFTGAKIDGSNILGVRNAKVSHDVFMKIIENVCKLDLDNPIGLNIQNMLFQEIRHHPDLDLKHTRFEKL